MVGADELRAVMGRFPAGVAVVTVAVPGQALGLTVASLVSLSLEPALVGFAIRNDAALRELLRDAGRLAVSMLAAGQEAVAQHFARGVPPIALWAGISLHEGAPDDPPELEGAVGWLRCTIRAEHETGDHTFFVVEVEKAELAPSNLQPLVFHGQSYASL